MCTRICTFGSDKIWIKVISKFSINIFVFFSFWSLGLCLIEVLSGKEVYENMLQHETLFNKKMAGENPTIPVTNTLIGRQRKSLENW